MKNKKDAKKEAVLILAGIRSVYNVGAIFRTADAAGITHIYLVGVTPSPLDRFGRERSDLHKAALGAEHSVAWTSVKTMAPLIKKLKKDGFTVIAIEQDTRSVDYRKVRVPAKTAFVLGEEVSGLPKKVLDACDVVAEIPMYGSKESLNVSVAAGVGLFRMLHS